MENENTKKILMILIVVLSVLFISLFICFKKTKGKPRLFEPYSEKSETKVDDSKTEEVKKDDKESDECDNNKFAFKSSKPISVNNSNLINKLDYSIMTKYYCYQDVCKNLEKQLLSYYKENNPNSKKTSGFAEYYIKLSNGKIKETKDGKTNQINGIKNVKSAIANFSVSNGIELFYLDTNNNLYFYGNLENNKGSKLLYKNVKDFTVFEGNDYVSSIIPSEGQNTTIALHTLDDKFMISYYSYDNFINIKNMDYKLLYLDEDFISIFLSQNDKYNYEKYNKKEIIANSIFITKDKLFVETEDNNLLYINIKENKCKESYKLYKNNKIKNINYDTKLLKVNIIFDDNSEQSFVYLKKMGVLE